ncbi:hypothetical protein [Oceanospirillum linum]|uniref:hypothetical protein n=1 Tax=Oceanospirillum linum TaxID=966 RepID=UPI0013579DAE|nr:hypothetical protein [Oceanospirillum linum]
MKQSDKKLPLVVVVHGSARTVESLRDGFIEFAEKVHCAVLAPLFPKGAVAQDEGDGYKLSSPASFPYDQILLSMVDEVSTTYMAQNTFCLYGFSGGAQFAHRFAYLHSERLEALSIHAPGGCSSIHHNITEEKLSALRATPVQMVVGERDTLSHTLKICRKSMLESLCEQWRSKGISVDFKIAAHIDHDGFALLSHCFDFFSEHISSADAYVEHVRMA